MIEYSELLKGFLPMWNHPHINMILLDEDGKLIDGNECFKSFLRSTHKINGVNSTPEAIDDLQSSIPSSLVLSDPAPRTVVISLPGGQQKFTRIILSESPKLIQLVEQRDSAKDLALLQSLPDMYFVLDETGWIKEFHAPDPNKLRIKPADMLEMSLRDMFPEDQFEEMMEPVKQALQTNGVITKEYAFDLENGEKQYFISRFVRIQGSRLVLSLAQDVTSLKVVENRLSSSMAELERSNKELEQFAYVASHDLQEPIRLIAGYTDLLRKSLPADALDDKSKMYMDFITQSTNRMKALINGLLDYSRLGNQSLETENVDLNDLLHALRFQFERHIQDLGAIIEVDQMPKNIACEPVQMGRLFQNLISNALKFRKPESTPTIHIGYQDRDSHHYFNVSDNGIGIKEAHFDKLFVIFSRLHLREKYEGNGLGLTIVKRIVERHNGKVWVTSTFGEGTTVHFTLPKQIQ